MSAPKVFEGIDWAVGRDRGYFVVTIGPDATQEDVQAFRDAHDLGHAWVEAEAALPNDGVHWAVTQLVMRLWATQDRLWEASATPVGGSPVIGRGASAAAALRALAVKLRSQ